MDDSKNAEPPNGRGRQLGIVVNNNNNDWMSAKQETNAKDVKVKSRKNLARDKDAPKPPLSGYIRFLIDKRAKYRFENPDMTFAESTRVLAHEWTLMSAEQKQPYLLISEQEKKKYLEQMQVYNNDKNKTVQSQISKNNALEDKLRLKNPELKTKTEENYPQKKKKKYDHAELKKKQEKPQLTKTQKKLQSTKTQENLQLTNKSKSEPSNQSSTVIDIPIFTDEFLNFNKAREVEMRKSRKILTDKKEEFSVLQKHIEIMNNTIEKNNHSIEQYRLHEANLEHCLNKYRDQFFNALSHIPLPVYDGVIPTVETFDHYMIKLAELMKTTSDPDLVSNVKEALCKLKI